LIILFIFFYFKNSLRNSPMRVILEFTIFKSKKSKQLRDIYFIY